MAEQVHPDTDKLEYGTDSLELHTDALKVGDRVAQQQQLKDFNTNVFYKLN